MWAEFERNQIWLRRGQLTLMVAAPGVGKSVIATSYVVQSGVRCLYVSMDTDEHTTCLRLICVLAKCTIPQAEAGLDARAPWALTALAEASSVKYAFCSSPDSTELGERVLAYGEAEGQFPELIVIDNLSDIAYDGDEFGELRRLMHDMQTMAGKTAAAVLVLHHAVGAYEDGASIIPMPGIAGKVSKKPTLILTAHRASDTHTGISVVKNRYGPADPAGFRVRATLTTDFERCQVHDSHVVGVTRNDNTPR